MKVSELAAGFAYEEPRAAAPSWLATPVDYTNRHVMAGAMQALAPDWAGFAPPPPVLPAGAAPPTTAFAAVLGGETPSDPALLFHEGRW